MDWAATIARHVLYETADAIRIEALSASDDPVVAGIAARIDREEVYHRMHAEMWLERLLASDEGRARLDAALDELWPYGARRARRGPAARAPTPARGAARPARSRTSSRSSAARTSPSSPSCTTR